MRVGQLQILTGDEIRDGLKLRTPLTPERQKETLPIARERELKVDHEREKDLCWCWVGDLDRETLCRWGPRYPNTKLLIVIDVYLFIYSS